MVVLGVGYYYFGMSSASISITNDAPAPYKDAMALYEGLKEQAVNIEETEEERVEAEIAALEAVLDSEQSTINTEQRAPQKAN